MYNGKTTEEYSALYDSPIGRIIMTSDGDALTSLSFEDSTLLKTRAETSKKTAALEDATRWLDIYFRGEIPDFTPKLRPSGTPFRKKIWDAATRIEYGSTAAYADIAEAALGRENRSSSARAVGGALGANPILIIIPCHRVVPSGGGYGGYSAGLKRKKYLLKLEAETAAAIKTEKNNEKPTQVIKQGMP